jgi:hypothetical protein
VVLRRRPAHATHSWRTLFKKAVFKSGQTL